MKNKTPTLKYFYKISENLLKKEVRNIFDLVDFYSAMNSLASEILSNTIIINELKTRNYSDNSKFFQSISYILGYGKAVENNKLLFKKAKQIKVSTFLKNNDYSNIAIEKYRTEAVNFFNGLKKSIDNCYSKEEIDLKIKIAKEEAVREAVTIMRSSQMNEQISIGPLKYSDYSISFKDKELLLTSQMVKLCRLFMERSQEKDTLVSNEDIIECISVKGFISRINMRKTVSKLRCVFKKLKPIIYIEKNKNNGYILITKNIR